MTGVLVSEIIKTGFITLISSKLLKVMGKKDFADIIAASGVCICGVEIAKLIIPICKVISKFTQGIADFFGGIEEFFNTIDKGINIVKNSF